MILEAQQVGQFLDGQVRVVGKGKICRGKGQSSAPTVLSVFWCIRKKELLIGNHVARDCVLPFA